MPAMMDIVQRYIHLKVLKILGISRKKFDFSNSLAVAPHDMFILNMCARRASERWNDKPPKNIVNIGSHLKLVRRALRRPCSPRRYRRIASVTLP